MKKRTIFEAPVVKFYKLDSDTDDQWDDEKDEIDVEWDDEEDTTGGDYASKSDQSIDQWDDEEDQPDNGDQPASDFDDPTGEPPPDEQDQQEDDPDRQGTIRTVPNAHLVYKRKDEQNQYTELWIFKQDYTTKISSKTYDAIIAGTDIPKGSSKSKDGSQKVKTWEIGPPQNTLVYVEITGLSN
jgi:hypothetical protein